MVRSDQSCVFCRILMGSVPGSFIHRGELTSAFLDIRPVTSGHILVVPNDHYCDLADLPSNVATELFLTSQQCAAALRASELVTEGINLFYADGAAAGQEIFHAHLHVIPRFRGDTFRVDAAWDIHPSRAEMDESADRLGELFDAVR